MNANGVYQEAENFCETLERADRVLNHLNHAHPNKNIIFFSHSMFGAACAILLGWGQKFENGDYLAFDGKRNNNTSYAFPHAQPIILYEKAHEAQKKSRAVKDD